MYPEQERGNELVVETWETAARPPVSGEQRGRKRRSPYSSLRATAEVIEGLVWLYGCFGAIASVVVMTRTDAVDSRLLASKSVHPYVALGLGLLLAVAITSAFLLLFSRWVAAWAYSKMH